MADCAPLPHPPPIPLADWPDSSERLDVPPHLQDFDAGALCIDHVHGRGAEALSEHVWLHWCARVHDLLVCAYYHDPMGCFVALLRASDGHALRGLKIAAPRRAAREDGLPPHGQADRPADGQDRVDRRVAWARATAIAVAQALRAQQPADPIPPETDAWLRRQLDGLGRRDHPSLE